jgi:hypothetical protein
MKWHAIAGITSQVNEEAKAYLDRKLQKDAAVELSHVWWDFITETGKHLHKSESNLEVVSNDKTGGLSCHTQFNELHEDFAEITSPFLNIS